MLRTERLVLRRWRGSDLAPFAALNADPEVRAYFPATLSRSQSDDAVERIEARIAADGFGFWALQVRETGAFIGFTGIARIGFTAPFTPAVEVGWRLARHAWGNGYATEAALAAVKFGFDAIGLDEVVSMTALGNQRSRAVMRRIGMARDPADDFAHPRLDPLHPLSRSVLYRLPAKGASIE